MALADDIFTRAKSLEEWKQRKVLDFIDSLESPPQKAILKGTPPEVFLQFAGCIPKEDLEDMKKAIEEAFETVEPIEPPNEKWDNLP